MGLFMKQGVDYLDHTKFRVPPVFVSGVALEKVMTKGERCTRGTVTVGGLWQEKVARVPF